MNENSRYQSSRQSDEAIRSMAAALAKKVYVDCKNEERIQKLRSSDKQKAKLLPFRGTKFDDDVVNNFALEADGTIGLTSD